MTSLRKCYVFETSCKVPLKKKEDGNSKILVHIVRSTYINFGENRLNGLGPSVDQRRFDFSVSRTDKICIVATKCVKRKSFPTQRNRIYPEPGKSFSAKISQFSGAGLHILFLGVRKWLKVTFTEES